MSDFEDAVEAVLWEKGLKRKDPETKEIITEDWSSCEIQVVCAAAKKAATTLGKTKRRVDKEIMELLAMVEADKLYLADEISSLYEWVESIPEFAAIMESTDGEDYFRRMISTVTKFVVPASAIEVDGERPSIREIIDNASVQVLKEMPYIFDTLKSDEEREAAVEAAIKGSGMSFIREERARRETENDDPTQPPSRPVFYIRYTPSGTVKIECEVTDGQLSLIEKILGKTAEFRTDV